VIIQDMTEDENDTTVIAKEIMDASGVILDENDMMIGIDVTKAAMTDQNSENETTFRKVQRSQVTVKLFASFESLDPRPVVPNDANIRRVSKESVIPKPFLGLVIGFKGDNMKRLKAQYNVRITLDPGRKSIAL
jgi:hypothetical protein